MSAYLVTDKTSATATSTALVVPKTTALVVTTPGNELLEVRKLAHTGESKFALVTQNRGAFYGNPPLQRVATWLETRAEVTKQENRANALGLTAALGAAAGSLAFLGFDLALVPAIALGASAFAAGISALGLAFGIKRLARHEREKASENLVPLAAIEDMTQRFAEAPAGEKATLGRVLTDWLNRMSTHQALSPEAMDALQQVSEENKKLPRDTVARAATLGQLVAWIDAKGDVESHAVSQMAQLINALPQADRYDVAQTVKAQLEQSGRKIDYQAKHALFAMVKSHKP